MLTQQPAGCGKAFAEWHSWSSKVGKTMHDRSAILAIDVRNAYNVLIIIVRMLVLRNAGSA
jgi:hypothetical protein